MTRSILLVAFGAALQAAVLVLPLTPYPLVRMALDREALEVERGYEQFLDEGIWEAGDPGFTLMRQEFMDDVARGGRQGFGEDEMLGLTLVAFQIGESEAPVDRPENQPVYVVFSNHRGHIIPGDFIKLMHKRFQEPYAAVANLALIVLGSVMIYSGLAGFLGGRPAGASNRGENPARGNALSPLAGS